MSFYGKKINNWLKEVFWLSIILWNPTTHFQDLFLIPQKPCLGQLAYFFFFKILSIFLKILRHTQKNSILYKSIDSLASNVWYMFCDWKIKTRMKLSENISNTVSAVFFMLKLCISRFLVGLNFTKKNKILWSFSES